MNTNKGIVIGSGVAGLAASIRLAVQGFTVEVYEKNEGPGGKLTAFEKEGFKFDAGPSLFTQPQNIEELFELANEPIANYFTYNKVDIACKYFFENGKQINAYTDVNLFAIELENTVNENPDTLKKYLSTSEKIYNNIGTIFLNHSLHKKRTWLHYRILKGLSTFRFSYIFKSLGNYNKKFKAKETQQIFNRFATYNGSNPFKAPAMLSLIPHLEQNQGTFYPTGGMVNITNALYKLALKKGVQFYFNAKVQNIICPENTAKGIVVNNKNVYADVIVSNSDVYYTYKNLLNNESIATHLLKQELSSSAFVFYWGINKSFKELGLHNILFAENYEKEFEAIFKTKKLFSDPTIYINITSKEDTGQAPINYENWFVMINVPSHTDYNVEKLKELAKKNIVTKLNRMLQTNIEELIVFEDLLHPQTIESNTNSHLGSLYGTSSNSRMAAFLRHKNFIGGVKNLYCCGGSVHPGGGIPLCLKSAKIVSDLIKRDTKKKRTVHA
jgi:phytoene desaturase